MPSTADLVPSRIVKEWAAGDESIADEEEFPESCTGTKGLASDGMLCDRPWTRRWIPFLTLFHNSNAALLSSVALELSEIKKKSDFLSHTAIRPIELPKARSAADQP